MQTSTAQILKRIDRILSAELPTSNFQVVVDFRKDASPGATSEHDDCFRKIIYGRQNKKGDISNLTVEVEVDAAQNKWTITLGNTVFIARPENLMFDVDLAAPWRVNNYLWDPNDVQGNPLRNIRLMVNHYDIVRFNFARRT
jgi:hypothetical protein